MSMADFLANEKKILSGIEEKGVKARTAGLKCGLPADGKSLLGYAVYLKYDNEFEGKIREFSDSVYNAVNGRAIKYGIENAHQTIGDLIVGERETRDGFNPNTEILDKLINASQYAFNKHAEERPKRLIDNPWTGFRDFVASSDSVLLFPMVGFGQYALIEHAYQGVVNSGIPVEKGNGNYRKAWGRHSTVNRFSEDIPAAGTEKLFELMDSQLLADRVGQFDAVSLNVGYFTLDKNGLDLRQVEAIEF